MKALLVLAIAIPLSSTCLAQAAADLERFGVLAELPDSWHTVENHSPSLPNFGVYMAKSDDGGYFWLMVNGGDDGSAVENVPHPDSLGAGVSIRSIPADERPDGYIQGHVVEWDSVPNYFFVGSDGDRRYRFRIGYEFKTVEPVGGEAEVLSGILKSISFLDSR